MKTQQLVFVAILLIAYQNCTNVNFDWRQANGEQARNSSGGGGDSYDGKPTPGDYYRVIPKFKCNGEFVAQATIKVTAQDALLHTINADCSSTDQTVDFTQIDYKSFNTQALGFKDGVYTKLESHPATATPAQVIEALCSTELESPSSGETVVIFSPYDGSANTIATIFKPNTTPLTVNVKRAMAVGTAAYLGEDLTLSINVNTKTGDQFTGLFDLAGKTENVFCRLAGSVDPLAPINAPALAFSLNGVRGRSDVVADAYLTDAGAPQVEVQNVPSAALYRATVSDASSGTVVCAEASAHVPLVTMSCSLSGIHNYTIRGMITTIYGQTFPGGNSPFAFYSPQVSTTAVVVAPAAPRAGQSVQFSATLTSSLNLSGAHVHFQVYDVNWQIINEQYTSNENFTSGAARTLTSNYTFPSMPGVYWLQVGIFDSSWAQNLGGTMTNLMMIVSP